MARSKTAPKLPTPTVAKRLLADATATLVTVLTRKAIRAAGKAAPKTTAAKPTRGRPRKTARAAPKAAPKRQRRASVPVAPQPAAIQPVPGVHVTPRVKGVRRSAADMEQIERVLTDTIARNPGHKAKAIATALGCTPRDLRDAFLTLEKAGAVHHTGRQQGARYYPGAKTKAAASSASNGVAQHVHAAPEPAEAAQA